VEHEDGDKQQQRGDEVRRDPTEDSHQVSVAWRMLVVENLFPCRSTCLSNDVLDEVSEHLVVGPVIVVRLSGKRITREAMVKVVYEMEGLL
jgi:hypothetical protein